MSSEPKPHSRTPCRCVGPHRVRDSACVHMWIKLTHASDDTDFVPFVRPRWATLWRPGLMRKVESLPIFEGPASQELTGHVDPASDGRGLDNFVAIVKLVDQNTLSRVY